MSVLQNVSVNAAEVRRNNLFNKHVKQNIPLYIIMLPGLIFLFVFNYVPLYGLLIAFKKFDIIKGIWGSPYIGFENFKMIFSSPDFYNVFKNSVLISVYRILWVFPVPILLAISLNEVKNAPFKRVCQSLVYLPHFISWVVVVGIIQVFVSPTDGIINYIRGFFGAESIAFLQQPEYFRTIIILSDIFKEAGWGSIIYLAAIAGISEELYEAAVIDGANRLQRIMYVTIPSITNTIIVILIIRLGTVLKSGFEQIFLLYNPMVYKVADVFETYTYRAGLQEGRFGFATAVGIFQAVVSFIIVISANKISKKIDGGGIW